MSELNNNGDTPDTIIPILFRPVINTNNFEALIRELSDTDLIVPAKEPRVNILMLGEMNKLVELGTVDIGDLEEEVEESLPSSFDEEIEVMTSGLAAVRLKHNKILAIVGVENVHLQQERQAALEVIYNKTGKIPRTFAHFAWQVVLGPVKNPRLFNEHLDKNDELRPAKLMLESGVIDN